MLATVRLVTSGTRLRALVTPVRLDAPTPGSLAGRAALSTAGVAVQGLVRFAYTFLIAHLLGDEAVGRTNAAISLALLVSLLWPTAAGSAASKFVALARGAGDTDRAAAVARHLGRWTFGTSVLLAGVAAAYAVLVLDSGPAGAFSTAVLVMAYSGYGFVRGVQFGVGQVARATAWDVISAALAIALLVAVLVGRLDGLLVLPLAIGYLLYAVTGWPRSGGGSLPRPLRREVDGFVSLTVVGTLASTGVSQASMLVAQQAAPGAQAGYYAAALALATPATMLSRSLSLVLFPTMAETHGRGDAAGLRRQTDLATRGLFTVMTLVLGGVVLLSAPLVTLVYPDSFAPAARLLPLQVAAVLFVTLGVACVNRLSSTSQRGTAVAVGCSVVGALVACVVWAFVAEPRGVEGVALGLVCWGAVTGLAPIAIVWRLDGHRWAGLVLRWLAAVVALVLLDRFVQDRGVWTAIGATVLFSAGWLALSAGDVRRAAALTRRR